MNASKPSLEEQVSFLKQKLESLTLENHYLREQNSKLADELDVKVSHISFLSLFKSILENINELRL